MDKLVIACFLFLSACTVVDINKNVTIRLADSSNPTGTNICQVPYIIPVTVNYFTTSETNLEDLLKADTQLQGSPGF